MADSACLRVLADHIRATILIARRSDTPEVRDLIAELEHCLMIVEQLLQDQAAINRTIAAVDGTTRVLEIIARLLEMFGGGK